MDVSFGAEAPASASEIALSNEGDAYRTFLEAKIKTAAPSGLPCALEEVPTHLTDGRPIKDHQRHLIRWAIEGGQRALFEAFGGLMTVPMRALKLGRRGAGVELNPAYFADGVRYLRETEAARAIPTLFDMLDCAA